MPKVVITITKNGQVKREAFGFTGASCIDKTSFLDSVFGEANKTELKDEYYQEEIVDDFLPSGYCG